MRLLTSTKALKGAIVATLVSTATAQTTSCKAACEIDLEAGTCDEALATLDFSGECCSLKEIGGTCFLVTTGRCRTEVKGEPLWDCEYDDNGDVIGCDPNFMQYISSSNAACPASEFGVPGFTDPPTPAPTPDGTAFNTDVVTSVGLNQRIDGDPAQGDCFTVEQTMFYTPTPDGCVDTRAHYLYYTGGRNGENQDTGWEREIYLQVWVTALHGCENGGIDQCTIKASNEDGTQTTCDECLYEDAKVTMVDCSNAIGIFPTGIQQVSWEALFNPGCSIPYEEEFFTLTFDEDKCLHPIYASNIPSTGPSLVFSSGPSHVATAAPSSEATWAGTAYTEIIDGDVARGDCYTVERYYQYNPWNDGCVRTDARYTYYVGGMNGDGEDTNYPRELYLEVEIEVYHDCDSTADRCSIQVNTNDGAEIICDACSYDSEKVTMVDCSNVGGIFPARSQTVSLEALFDSSLDVPYEENFFGLAYDEEKCMHPIYEGTYAPSQYWTPGPTAGVVVNTYFPTMWATASDPTASPSSQATWAGTAYIGRIDGDPSQGDCYTVEQLYSYNPWTDGCIQTNARYSYYIGGVNGNDESTNFPREDYLEVQVEAFHDCDSTADQCTIQVTTNEGAQISCDECFFDNLRVVMVDCSSAGGIFPSGSQAISLESVFDIDQDVPYAEEFFTLSYDEEKCLHPIYAGITHTIPPTQAPVYTISPGVIASSASSDIYDGDVALGDCYSVERYWEYTTYTNGCNRSYLRLTYYNGGLNGDYVNTGYPQETYTTVVVNVPQRQCPDPVANPDQCTITVGDNDCNACSIDGNFVTMADCPSGIFADELQTVSLYWDSSGISYENRFFRLAYDEDKCLHPALADSLLPSSFPSYMGTANTIPPTQAPVGVTASSANSDIYDGDVALGDCYSVDRYQEYATLDNDCGRSYLSLTYYNGGLNGDYADTGYPQETYMAVVVYVPQRDCPDPVANPAQCSISVGGDACNACSIDGNFVTMMDCSNVGIDIFAGELQIISLDWDSSGIPYENRFFRLAYDEDKCLHPALADSLAPSSFPSYQYSDAPTTSSPTPDPQTYDPQTFPPSYTGTEPPPSHAPWPDDDAWWQPTVSPVPSRLRCFSESSNGLVEEGTCHATDKDSCIEEWEDGCSEVTAFFTYYNFAGAGTREFYYYVRIIASSGCNSESNPDQPVNGCRVQHANTAVDCLECFVDGDLVSLVDCTNLPEVFEPTQGQVISLSRAGDAFDVVETEEMCSHPAVTLSSDSAPDSRGGGDLNGTPKTLDNTPKTLDKGDVTFPIDVTLHFRFFKGKGGEPTKSDVGMLATEFITFFDLVLMGNQQFGDDFLGIEMTDIESHYSSDTTPDDFSLTATANVNFERGTASVTARDAAKAMADSNLTKYLNHYVRKNKSGQRNIFFQVQTVRFKGIGGHE